MSIPLTEELLGVGSRSCRTVSGEAFITSFRDVRQETVRQETPVMKGGDKLTCTSTDVPNLPAYVLVLADNDGRMSEDGLNDDCETEGGDCHSVKTTPAATTDHRHVSSDTEEWKKVNKIMLGKAVQSIPAYIERSSLIVALVPLCKHADREDEICDQSSWRGRGWCRVEYMGAALVRSDVSVMIVKGALATPAFVWPVDGLQLPPGHGTYTCCSRKIINASGTQPFILHP